MTAREIRIGIVGAGGRWETLMSRAKWRFPLFGFLTMVLIALPSGCATEPQTAAAPASLESPTEKTASQPQGRSLRRPAPSRADFEVGQTAAVSEISAEVGRGRVTFAVRGTLPDGCTSVRGLNVAQKDRRFDLVVWTERPKDAVCTMALTPFSKEISMDAKELPPGDYTVHAGNQTAAFSLPDRNADG
jgi:inhibitor of cysteine peptidase